MLISIRVDEETDVATIGCSGVFGLDDGRKGAAALWEDPAWTGRAAVWDFREAVFDFSASEIQELARFILQHQPTPPPEKIAFVTGRDVDFGLARMFEVYRKGPETAFRVFRSYSDAITWLGIQDRPSG